MSARRRKESSGDHADEDHLVHNDNAISEAPDWPTLVSERSKADVQKSLPVRLFHWGPAIALFLIFFIGISASYLNTMWWPVDSIGGFLHMSVFLFWNYSVLVNFCKAAFIGGGYLPKEWIPEVENAEDHLQKCDKCRGFKAPRAHHCSKCGRCVMKMDHHCPWINNCVGHRNHAYFVFFLASAVIGCTHACFIITCAIFHAFSRSWYLKYAPDEGYPMVESEGRVSCWEEEGVPLQLSIYSLISCVMACAFSAGVAVAVGVLLFIQMKTIRSNKTAIEDYIMSKAEHARQDEDDATPFIYPYDLGSRRNFAQEEQLRQKAAKRDRSRLFRILVSYKEGEEWVVSRGSKGWLYGKKMHTQHEIKGWFPSKYAEMVRQKEESE